MVKILIYGTGHVGSQIADNLVTKSWLEQIYLYDLATEKADGLEFDIKDAFPSVSVSAVNDLESVLDLDIVIYCASLYHPSERKKSPIDRSKEWIYNRQVLKIATDKLFDIVVRTNSRLLVVSNPVDKTVKYFGSKLSEDKVVGIKGSLDAIRLSVELKKECVEFSYLYLIGKCCKYKLITDANPEKLEAAKKSVQNRLLNLILNQGYASRGIARATVKFIEQLYSGEKSKSHCSLHHDGSVSCRPVILGLGEINTLKIPEIVD